jgi:hypothetical protein
VVTAAVVVTGGIADALIGLLTHASNIVRVGWSGDAIGGDRYLLLSIAKNAAQEIRGQLVI